MEIVRRLNQWIPRWLQESCYVFILFLGLAGLFVWLPFRPVDTTMYPGDVSTFYAPQKSVAEVVHTRNSILADAIMIYTPRHTLMWEQLKAGANSTYNPYILGGRPAGMNWFYIVLQIPGWLIGGVIDAFLINTLWQTALSAVFFYWLIRDWSAEHKDIIQPSRFAALAGAIVWLFGQHQIVWYMFPAHLHTQILFPLVLWAFRRLWYSTNKWFVLGFFPLLYFVWSSGYTQGVIYLLLMLGLYFWYLVWQERTYADLPKLIQKLIGFAVPVGIFIAILAPSLFSWTTKLESGIRGEQSGEHTPTCELCTIRGAAQSVAGFIQPDMLGNTHQFSYFGEKNIVEYGRYMSLLPWLLLIGAWLTNTWRKDATFFVGVALLAWSIMHGVPGITQLIYGVPFLNLGQATRLITLVLLSGAIWSSLLFDDVTQKLSVLNWKSFSKRSVIPLVFLIIVGSLLIMFSFLVEPLQQRWILRSGLIAALVAAGYGVLAVLGWSKRISLTLFRLVLIAYVFLELMLQLGNFNTFSQRSQIFPDTELTSWLQENIGNNRVHTSGTIYLPNSSALFKIPVINGYSTSLDTEYYQWIQNNFTAVETTYNGFLRMSAESNEVTNQMAVKYVLSEQAIDDSNLQLVTEKSGVYVYENTTAWPRVWTAAATSCASYVDLKDCVLSYPQASISSEIQSYVQYENGSTFTISTREDSLLVFSEQWYPDWVVTIGDQTLEPIKVSPALIAVPLPAGEDQSVNFEYRPKYTLPGIRNFFTNRL